MNGLIEEYFGSALNGQVTMGQMLLLGGAALFVFSILLSIIFAVSKVKYNPDKAKKESGAKGAQKTAAPIATKKEVPVQNSPVVQPRQQEAVAQNGTVILPKQQEAVAQNGTVILPRQQEAVAQNGTVILPKQQEAAPQYTERGTVILPKQEQK